MVHFEIWDIRILGFVNWMYWLCNSSHRSVAYMRQWTGSLLVQVMACRLFGVRSLPQPMLPDFSEIWIEILSFSFKNMYLKMSSAKMSAILFSGGWVKCISLPLSFGKNGGFQIFHPFIPANCIFAENCLLFLYWLPVPHRSPAKPANLILFTCRSHLKGFEMIQQAQSFSQETELALEMVPDIWLDRLPSIEINNFFLTLAASNLF